MCDDEVLLSFGDDTIAAINHLEVSRLVSDLKQNENADLKNASLILSQRHSGLHLSPLPLQSSRKGSEKHAELNPSVDKSTSLLCTEQKHDLAMWGLPSPILQQYEARGIKQMFTWQVECLYDADVLDGKNLIYSAPTSAGKTLVAELLTIKTILEKKKKAVIIQPYVSVVREKMFYFKSLLETSGVRVEGLMGSHRVQGGIKNVDIAVCTIEKANALINRLMEEDSLHVIGIVVIDELHLIGDPFRGYLLELLITKIRYMSTKNDDINIQMVGMSATLPNLEVLASWLDAHLYNTEFRPIPLNEYLKVGPVIFNKNLDVIRTVEPKFDLQDDPDDVIHLCLETIFNGHSSLIFCPTKNWCEKLAINIAKEFYNIGSRNSEFGLKLREQLKSEAIAEALEQLKACPVGLDSALGKSVSFGVAFHHAGLTIDERDIIEGLFRSGIIRVLIATSTLSSGVNLPARRVLIRTPIFHRKPLDVLVYKQMVGRAGRMGKDSEGESILLCNKTDQNIGEQIIQNDLKPIASCLGHGELSSSLKRAILEVIASGVAETPEQVQCYTNCTLLAASHTGLENPIESCIKFLLENECIRLQISDDNSKKYVPTPLGNACLAASMSPDDGLELFQELQKARQCFVLENELHLVYLVTPFSVSAQWTNLDWLQIMSFWEKLPPSMRRVGSLVGVDEAFMIRAVKGTVNLHNYKQVHKLSIHRRFYTALALQELVNEVPLIEVASKFQCSKGMLQSLQQTSATFAGMVTAFCKRLGWKNLELLVSQFQERLQFGVHRELCELMHLDILNGPRARALFNSGIKSLGDLACANICEVENALHKSVSFQTSKNMEGETAYDTASRNQFKTIWITGKEGLTEREAAALLIKEARLWLQQELGLVDVKWGNDHDESTSNDEDNLKPENSSALSHDYNTSYSEVRPAEKDDTKRNDTVTETQLTVSESETEVLDLDHVTTPREHDEQRTKLVNNPYRSMNNSCFIFEQGTSDMLNNKGTILSNSKKVENHLEATDAMQESQSFDIGSSEDIGEVRSEQQTYLITSARSPTNDIFELSQKDTSRINEINLSNDSFSNSAIADCNVSLTDTVHVTSQNFSGTESVFSDINSDCENVDSKFNCNIASSNSNLQTAIVSDSVPCSNNGVSDVCSSRYSLDIFASPMPTTCKSPILFEDSLVIDSYLGNLLDRSRVSFQEPVLDSEKKNKNSKSLSDNVCKNNLSKPSNIEQKQNNSLTNNLAVSINIAYPLPHQANASVNKITAIKRKHYSDNPDLPNDDVLRLSVGTRNQLLSETGDVKSDVQNGNALKESGKISLCDDITDSFLKQAFTTICDFDDYSDVDKVLVKGLNSGQGKETIHFSNGALCGDNSDDVKTNEFETMEKFIVIPNNVQSPKKTKLLSAENLDCALDDKTYIRNEKDNLNDIKSTETKLTFVSDSDEDENDLVPSSQSQSEISCHQSNSHNVTWKKKQRDKRTPPLKRKRFDEKEVFKPEHTSILNSVIKKLKTQSLTSWDSFKVIDVCAERKIFEQLKEEFKTHSHIAFSFACEKCYKETSKESIGDKILGRKSKKIENVKKLLLNENCSVVGFAVCLGDKTAYYIALDPTSKGDASQGPISFGEQLNLLESLMMQGQNHFLSAFDIKEQYKVLYRCCSVNIEKEVYDPKVAEWMLDSENSEKSLRLLMTKYLPNSLKVLKRVGNSTGIHSLGLHFKSSIRARIRACVEAVVTWHLINVQLNALEECKLLKVYKEVEMPTILCLARMELNGIGFCRAEAEKLQKVLQNELTVLEKEAFKLAKHSFSLSSPTEVSKVLFKELQLKSWKYTSAHKPSTSKDVLIKLKDDHPLPSIILEWRKIYFIMTKVILPFLKVEFSDRIFGCYITHTVTGRINMHEPNLQSIPRDFDVTSSQCEIITVSMREAFIPKSGKLFISADYSQLELRLLAHLSQDKTLLHILKNGADVFKSIAAKWKQISEGEVTDNLRQKAKQVCYGVIYGIGASALSDQLEVDEDEATSFMKTFLDAYPGLKKFRQDVIKKCREQGYVETLSGRKRFLPLINSNKQHLRAQAERQAVNTTVQGSAADIAKTGMVLVEASLKAAFRNESPRIRRLRENKRQCIETATATLVLHLHDELLYEVCDEYTDEVIHIIKGGMEAAANLTVPLPVRVKCGKSWGALKEIF